MAEIAGKNDTTGANFTLTFKFLSADGTLHVSPPEDSYYGDEPTVSIPIPDKEIGKISFGFFEWG